MPLTKMAKASPPWKLPVTMVMTTASAQAFLGASPVRKMVFLEPITRRKMVADAWLKASNPTSWECPSGKETSRVGRQGTALPSKKITRMLRTEQKPSWLLRQRESPLHSWSKRRLLRPTVQAKSWSFMRRLTTMGVSLLSKPGCRLWGKLKNRSMLITRLSQWKLLKTACNHWKTTREQPCLPPTARVTSWTSALPEFNRFVKDLWSPLSTMSMPSTMEWKA